MAKQAFFTIYNASAGSGKTFTLVKEYLKILFKSNHPLEFRTVLALTFTNKAVAEMKERVIKMLKEFSDEKSLTSPNAMFEDLVEELSIQPLALHQKSKVLLQTIVHNYAGFDISTIDKFNHKLIRTFALDLKLPLNFEVELDTNTLLSKAVDKLIDKTGTDDKLTKVLVDFAIEKADDDKSWDVSKDFKNIAKLLINENDIPFIDTIKHKTLEDFTTLKSHLTKKAAIAEKEIITIAQNTLELIVNYGLQFDDFSGSYLPKHFQKLVDGDFNVNFGLAWQTKLIEGGTLYPTTRVTPDTASTIDSIQPQICKYFEESKAQVFHYKFLKNALKNITPLSVLNAINNSLNELKEENDLLLISEFNSIISTEINAQPAPFIYERIGEKFRHYFIDEFQDTSQMQWHNLIPLVDNALSGENIKGETGTAMLVGDAKQAIYRWRGGKAEQFIELYTDKNPFFVEKRVEDLPANYRSFKEIVNFNNSFFGHLSKMVFSDQNHQTIYEHSKQEVIKSEEGYVELSFLDVKNMEEEEDKNLLHCQKVHDTILKAQANGYELKDMCIITRKSKEGIVIAEYLSNKQIPVISSESLLLKNSPEVNFINNVLTLASQPENNDLKIAILSYLADYKLQLEDKHSFYLQLVHLGVDQLFQSLEKYEFKFNFKSFLQLPMYEAAETVVRQFKLNEASNAYLQFYMDEILDYSQKHNASFSGFSEYWELKKDKLSVVSPQGNDAVQIMTIHKSKGLEFPVVIFPYANQDIYFDMSPKVWFPVEKENFVGFSNLFLNLNKELEDFGDQGVEMYQHYRSELELDTVNLLYVVMTRAIEQLYVISELDLDSKGSEKLNWYSGLFINYLKTIHDWEDSKTTYTFGNAKRSSVSKEKNNTIIAKEFITVSREDHQLHIVTNSGYLWDTAQEKAIEKGNLVHNIMSQIKSTKDIDYVLNNFLETGKINLEQFDVLKPIINHIVNHIDLKAYFEESLLIYNERDIITKDGELYRPDRVVVDKQNSAVIIDYKTGNEKEFHKSQLFKYQEVLEDMGFKVSKKILIYINEAIQIKEF